MRWISLCTIVGAALLPAVTGRPLCRPDQSTTTLTTTTEAASSTISTYSTTTPEITPSTPTPTPPAENYIMDGDFEGDDTYVWSLRTVSIANAAGSGVAVVEDPDNAHSPDHYARFEVNNYQAVGGNQLNQTINGLDTGRLYRLSFSSAIFDTPLLGASTCKLEALQQDTIFKSWDLDPSVLNQYQTYSTEFVAADEDIWFTLRLRCTTQNYVTITVGLDDISIYDIGKALVRGSKPSS